MADERARPLGYQAPPPRDAGEDARLYLGVALTVMSFAAAAAVVGLALYNWLR